ncbi:SGNH/GDSL hydrolase family protein [Capilliphycus salinus ALCB114379]|uniref:SGNH/GDSL hydrolase family protein n=1 Tax=Capilliphycus salinus TaxID=2768948 RepID=UPI0039A4D7FD
MKIVLIILAVFLGLLILAEFGLRVIFGFGRPLIYQADEDIGYLLVCDQKTRRFGNRIEINQYSMRSSPITPVPDSTTLRILLLGDSIVNGGWWTDQSQIISEMLAQQLNSTFDQQTPPQKIEVLNVAANSWGPPNQLAYLRKFGTFQAGGLILIINTDDLFTQPPNPQIVGRDRNYPDRQPPAALVEVFNRFRSPAPPPPSSPPANDLVGYNLEAIQEIRAIAAKNEIPFLLAMTPLLREIGSPGPRDYEIKARQRLTELTESLQILYIDFLPRFNSTCDPETFYRDHIHLSVKGNQFVTDQLSESWQKQLKIPVDR